MFLEKVSADINDDDLDDLARFQMNGRQVSLLWRMWNLMVTYCLQLTDQEYSKQRALSCIAEKKPTLKGARPFGVESD